MKHGLTVSHNQMYADRQRLWTEIGPAWDMTGGYEDVYDMEKLLANPCKNVARRCLLNQIRYWFHNGPSRDCDVRALVEQHPWAAEIGYRYKATYTSGEYVDPAYL